MVSEARVVSRATSIVTSRGASLTTGIVTSQCLPSKDPLPEIIKIWMLKRSEINSVTIKHVYNKSGNYIYDIVPGDGACTTHAQRCQLWTL